MGHSPVGTWPCFFCLQRHENFVCPNSVPKRSAQHFCPLYAHAARVGHVALPAGRVRAWPLGCGCTSAARRAPRPSR